MPKKLCVTVVRVRWEGPLSYDEARNRSDPKDRGLYQIYSTHPVFGRNSLIYIGKTERQTFSTRLFQHWVDWVQYESETSFFLGRIAGEDSTSEEEWESLLSDVDRLAIFRNQPPGNSCEIKELGVNYPLLVQNFGPHGALLHEFSSLRMPPGEGMYAGWDQFLVT